MKYGYFSIKRIQQKLISFSEADECFSDREGKSLFVYFNLRTVKNIAKEITVIDVDDPRGLIKRKRDFPS